MKKTIVKIGLASAIALIGVNCSLIAGSSSSVEIVNRKHKTETFKVYGNCGMCEKTIEESLKNVRGVEKADWNKETKMIEVTFDAEVLSLKEIKQKIADVGYDTDEVRATEKAYNGLPGCCQYERPKSNNEHHKHEHKH
ncbi:MAG: ATPase [Crocinitomicaceae bacterium]|nr:ATPase [Crocinitomicaceae bacterium]|tara:strand:+ start:9086 stop:9502 length:417 start_codon:yes stop_codon:yes gene_type:complete